MSRATFKYSAKTKNRRVEITLFKNPDDLKEEPFFVVHTKRLVSFKDRKITQTNNVYTVETMIVMAQLLGSFLDEPEVNKSINPFSKFETWKAESIIFKK